jgi:hypothetical protein
MAAIAAATAVAAGAGAGWSSSSPASKLAIDAPAVACPKSGFRFVSTSPGGKKNMCFAVARNGRKLLGAIFFVWGDQSCTGTPLSAPRTSLRTKLRVLPDGTFSGGAFSVRFTNESIRLVHDGVLSVGTHVSASATFRASFIRGTRSAVTSLAVQGEWSDQFGPQTMSCEALSRWTARKIG